MNLNMWDRSVISYRPPLNAWAKHAGGIISVRRNEYSDLISELYSLKKKCFATHTDIHKGTHYTNRKIEIHIEKHTPSPIISHSSDSKKKKKTQSLRTCIN